MAGAADLQDGTHLLVAHPPRCAIGPPLTAGEIARIIVAIAKSILEMDEKIYTTADDCHKGNAFQTACGHGAPPAAHRRKTDRVHCGFASDPALCKPLLIIEVELVDQPTYVKNRRHTQYDGEYNSYCANILRLHGSPPFQSDLICLRSDPQRRLQVSHADFTQLCPRADIPVQEWALPGETHDLIWDLAVLQRLPHPHKPCDVAVQVGENQGIPVLSVMQPFAKNA